MLENALKNFGVTEKETEVYIFLSKRGFQKTGYIAKQLRTNSGLIYRILKSLQKKGLVEATLEYPTRYTAVPLQKVIDAFVKSKREEVAQIEEAKNDLLSIWNEISQSELDTSVEKFSVIEGNKKIFQKISQMIKQTKNQFSMVSSISNLLRAEHFEIFDLIKNHILKSNIHFRILTQTLENDLKAITLLQKKLKILKDFRSINPSYKSSTFSRMVIRDKEEIILFISSEGKKEVGLCTNCRSIIESFSMVFQDYWKDSVDIQKRIDEIKTGKLPSEMRIIKNPETAKKTYYKKLDSAKEEVLFVTSSKGLIHLEKMLEGNKWVEKGIKIRFLAPITTENLNVVKKLLEYSEVRHVPLGYLETTIIDNSQIFQFKHQIEDSELDDSSYFDNTFYSNDLSFVNKTKNMLYDIWKKTRTPSSENIRSITRIHPTIPKAGHHSLFKKTIVSKNMKYQQMGKITEKDVLNKIVEEKKISFQSSNWFDFWWYFGSRAFAVIHPPEDFSLPDLVIGIFHNEEESTFGNENRLIIDIKKETEKGYSYVPVTFVQDNSKSFETKKKAFGDYAEKINFLIFKKTEFYVQIKGNTLFAGWTKPIPIGFSNYVLPPSCLLFEGYGEVKPGLLTNSIPRGRRQEIWFNSFDAFVTYFHPKSKYIGSGSDGFIERDSLFMSVPTGT